MVFEIRTHIGNRDNNEDYALAKVKEENGYFVLADGLGGHGRGEVASEEAATTAMKALESQKTLEECFLAAESAVRRKQEQLRAFDQMKSTLTLLKIEKGQAEWGHIGDSRLYQFSKLRMIERTLDHSVPQMLVEAGQIKAKDIRHHEDRNRLLHVIGAGEERLGFQIRKRKPCKKGQAYLLCSDGWWELIEEKKMLTCFRKAKTIQEWMDAMEQVIQENGKDTDMDNYTAIGIWI